MCHNILNFYELIKHLKGHIDNGTSVRCPVEGCSRLMSKKSTFTAHLSVKHGSLCRVAVNSSLLVHCRAQTGADDSTGVIEVTDSAVDESSICLDAYYASANEKFDESVDRNLFVRNLALFFLKLQCRCSVPASTVELIACELYNLHSVASDISLPTLKSRLIAENVTSAKIDAIVCEIHKNDVFKAALNTDDGVLRSQYKRKRFYTANFRYVEPVQIILGQNKCGTQSVFHYVPLRQTLISMLQDETVANCLAARVGADGGTFTDLCDGEVYKRINQTVEHDSFLEVILYQDVFEIVNPLGAAKNLHKILAVYMALGNIPAYARTCIDNLQLVLLCRECDLTYFGQDAVFQCLVNDLCDLETNGVCFSGTAVAVRLVCVLGDNLGSHYLGGYSTNFSMNSYVCRYCLVQKSADKCSLSQTGDLRTPENYNSAVSTLGLTPSVQGITCSSVLNCLKYYHVCMPGLPPCLGHDLFEGVVKFDLALILKVLIRGKKECNVLSFQYLNKAIKQFKFLGTDGHDKPAIVCEGKTVGGHAAQVWCLLRLLPVILHDVVDVDHEAWHLFLLLKELVELVCAPKVSTAQVLYLNRLVKEYLETRLKLFPSVPLRPKHHYLLHYPWLIQMFGPLIHVWTMRMESKHSFFKRCARNSHNFINISKTLAETHQLNLAYLSSGPTLCGRIMLGCDSATFDEELFSPTIVLAVKACGSVQWPLQCSSHITVKGTKYSKDAYVVVNCVASTPIFGKIKLCLLDNAGVGALVIEMLHSRKDPRLGLYCLTNCDEMQSIKCILIDELFDYCPLPAYNAYGAPHIALKHAVCVNAEDSSFHC